MRIPPAIALIVLLALACTPADAQRRRRWSEPIPAWGVEAIGRASLIKDDPVVLAGGRVGRQMDSTLNLGLAAGMLITESAETQRADGFDRTTSLIYAGPSLELRDSLRGPARFIVRATALVGLAGYEAMRNGIASSGTALIVGAEPEVGLLVRVNRFLQWSATVGVLYGWRVDGGPAIVSGPSAALGLRFVY